MNGIWCMKVCRWLSDTPVSLYNIHNMSDITPKVLTEITTPNIKHMPTRIQPWWRHGIPLMRNFHDSFVVRLNGLLYWLDSRITGHLGDGKEINSNLKHTHAISLEVNKANLRDLIAATGLVILLELDSNHWFFSPCDLEIWWMTQEKQ